MKRNILIPCDDYGYIDTCAEDEEISCHWVLEELFKCYKSLLFLDLIFYFKIGELVPSALIFFWIPCVSKYLQGFLEILGSVWVVSLIYIFFLSSKFKSHFHLSLKPL